MRQHAAEEQSQRRTTPRDRPIHGEGPGAIAGFRKGDGEQGERGRGEQRGEGALRGARREEYGKASGRTADRRRQRESGQPDEERALAANGVCNPPADEQESGEGERVGGDHPLSLRV